MSTMFWLGFVMATFIWLPLAFWYILHREKKAVMRRVDVVVTEEFKRQLAALHDDPEEQR